MRPKTNIPFSVCMSVYKNDNAGDFSNALRSVSIEQTVAPSEIILVADGPISDELLSVIKEFANQYANVHFIQLPTNCGHAIARQTAIDAAKYDWIAIMDSDDIACPNRFEKQIDYIVNHPDIDVIGGQITEFLDEPINIVGRRIVPCSDFDIKQYMKSRCPMNFVTVMIHKKALTSVGGIIDWFCEEDYYLWIRMALNDCTFANIPLSIVNVRVGKDMYQRRGGWKYFRSERDIQQFMHKNHMISYPRYCYNVLGRFAVQVLMPNKLRGFIFQHIFRKKH